MRGDARSSRLERYSGQAIHEMAWARGSNGPDTISPPNPLRLCKRPDTKKEGSTQKSRGLTRKGSARTRNPCVEPPRGECLCGPDCLALSPRAGRVRADLTSLCRGSAQGAPTQIRHPRVEPPRRECPRRPDLLVLSPRAGKVRAGFFLCVELHRGGVTQESPSCVRVPV